MTRPPLSSFIQKPTGAPGIQPPASTNVPKTGYSSPLTDVVNKVGNYFSGNIGDAAQSGISQMKQGVSDITSGKLNPVQGAEAGLSTESGLATLLSSPLAPLLKPLGAAVNAAGNIGYGLAYLSTKVGLMSPAQKAAYEQAQAKFANSGLGQGATRVATDLSNAGNMAGTITGVDSAIKATPGIINKVSDVAGKVSDNLSRPVAPKASPADHVPAVAKDWEEPSKIQGSSYNKARAALSKAPDSPTVLAKAGINPFAHIEDGKFNTADTADALHETANKISHDVVRPALHVADYTAPKTPATDLADAAKLQVDTLSDVTAGNAAKIKTAVDSELAALHAKYPDGMSLTDMHDEKIAYSKNSGYSQFKSDADTNTALAHKAISLTLKDAIEAGVPEEAPIHETNAYLGKLHHAADYLESLHGTKAPVSTARNVARFAAKFGGAALARHLTPGLGELVSSFAGYQIGKAVENVLENMTNAGRAEFLGNMQKTNPEVVAKLQEYLNSAPK